MSAPSTSGLVQALSQFLPRRLRRRGPAISCEGREPPPSTARSRNHSHCRGRRPTFANPLGGIQYVEPHQSWAADNFYRFPIFRLHHLGRPGPHHSTRSTFAVLTEIWDGSHDRIVEKDSENAPFSTETSGGSHPRDWPGASMSRTAPIAASERDRLSLCVFLLDRDLRRCLVGRLLVRRHCQPAHHGGPSLVGGARLARAQDRPEPLGPADCGFLGRERRRRCPTAHPRGSPQGQPRTRPARPRADQGLGECCARPGVRGRACTRPRSIGSRPSWSV